MKRGCGYPPAPSKVLPGVVQLLHVRPELASRGWDEARASLAAVLRDAVVSNA